MNTSVRLENKTAGHNKFYEFVGIQNNKRFIVKGLYGAIGQAPKEAVIYDGDDKTQAEKEYQKKLSEKQKKGYTVVSRNGKVASAATEEKKTLLMFQ
jgi:predicted DNA-binding WGR domain protein